MPHLQLCRHRLVQGSVQNGSPGVKLPRADDGFVMALQERGPAQPRLTGLGVPASPGAPTGRDMAAGTAAQWNAGEAIGVGHGGHGWAGGGQHAHPHCRTGEHGCSQVEPRPHGARRYRTAMMLRFCVGDPLVLFNTRHSSVRWSAVRSCALVSGPQPARHAWQPDLLLRGHGSQAQGARQGAVYTIMAQRNTPCCVLRMAGLGLHCAWALATPVHPARFETGLPTESAMPPQHALLAPRLASV